MAHISDFSKSADEIILDLINDTNVSDLTLLQIQYGSPAAIEGAHNTQLQVNGVLGSGIGGQVTVTYNRLPIQLFVPAEGLDITDPDAVLFSELIPVINQRLGIRLSENDIVDDLIGDWAGVPDETKTLSIQMSPDALCFIDALPVTLRSDQVLLSAIWTQPVLDGFDLPA